MAIHDWARCRTITALVLALSMLGCAQQEPAPVAGGSAPRFRVDPFWPKYEHGIQVVRRDGTVLREYLLDPRTLAGPMADIAISQDSAQRYLFVGDGSNSEVYILDRNVGVKLGALGRPGRMVGEFRGLHNIAIDSKGNLYTTEVGFGRRVQKFSLQ